MDRFINCKTANNAYGRGGFSYTEVILTSMIMASLMIAGLRLSTNLGQSRQVCLDRDSAMILAIEMIEEIKGQSYRDPNGGALFGVEKGESTGNRSLFDDVDDYNGWSSSPPKDRSGAALDEYTGYTRSVQVRFVKADNFDDGVGSDKGFKEVVISIYRGGREIEQQKYVIADINYRDEKKIEQQKYVIEDINWGVEIEDDD